MVKDENGNVRITVIEINGANDLLVESIRAAVSNRDANHQRTVRSLDTSLEGGPATGSQFAELAPSRASQMALPPSESPPPASYQSAPDARANKKRPKAQPRGKSDSIKSTVASERHEKMKEVIQASDFDDYERYAAAIGKRDIDCLDQAALVARLAQTKFGVMDGLAPSEILQILRERFSINRNRKVMEQALRRASRTFFSISPAPFHHRAKLYRPMRDCIDRVEDLLNEFNHARLDEQPPTEAVKAATAN